MQTARVDRYEEELNTAIQNAKYMPSDVRWRVKHMRFVGRAPGKFGMMHYYYDQADETYYYESDFDREMRIVIQNKNRKKYIKK